MVAIVEPVRAEYPYVLDTIRRGMERCRGLLALMVLEIGNLPELEMRMGLGANDAQFARLAGRMAEALRSSDAVLRIGDGRYCILAGVLKNRGHALLAAEKLWRLAEESILQSAIASTPDIRIGIAIHPLHAQSPPELLRCAQLAVAGARERNERFLVYDDGCALQSLRRWELKEHFTAALEGGEIEMHYQPLIRIADGATAGAEALMRWIRDGRAVATPDVFIPLAEEVGLAHSTAGYALNVAMRQAQEWPVHGQPLSVAVNITAQTLHHPEFNAIVERALRTWSFPAQRLTLEITEGALIVDPDEARTKLHALRGLGVRVAIDDFGTGYSSLSYFKKIPADELKVDKSFVTRMLKDESDERIVRTIIALARSFGLDVVAEGVEDAATLAVLAGMGCEFAQGYHFAPALPQERFVQRLAETAAGR